MKRKSGQILVIVLIVMMVLGITIVAITNNNIRDVQQSTTNISYERNYSIAEEIVIQLGQNDLIGTSKNIIISDIQENVAQFTEESPECTTTIDEQRRESRHCTGYIFDNTTTQREQINARVIDSPFLERIRIIKDESITFRIDPAAVPPFDQTNIFNVSLEGDAVQDEDVLASIEVILDFIYEDNQGEKQYSSVRGIFDRTGEMFPSQENHYFDFTPEESGNVINSFSFSFEDVLTNIIEDTNDFYPLLGNVNPSSIEPLGLRFKLLYSTPNKEIIPALYLNVQNSNPQPIVQSRIIETTITQQSEVGEAFGPQPFVSASIPQFKTPPILDYAIRSNNDLTHQ